MLTHTFRALRLLLTGLATSLITTAAAAYPYIRQPGAAPESSFAITPMLAASVFYGAEAGVKADYLVANPAFIPKLNNAVFAEASVFIGDSKVFVAPLIRWDFNLHPEWTLYGEAGIEFGDGIHASFSPGAIWRIPNQSFYVRGDIDWLRGVARIGPMLLF